MPLLVLVIIVLAHATTPQLITKIHIYIIYKSTYTLLYIHQTFVEFLQLLSEPLVWIGIYSLLLHHE